MANPRQRAVRTARAASMPARAEVRAGRREARHVYRQGLSANRAAYDALQRELGRIGADYRGDYAGLREQLGGIMPQLAGMAGYGGGMQGALALDTLGSTIGGALAGLVAQQQRGTEWTRSSQRQAGIEKMTNARNMLLDFRNRINELRKRSHDIAAQEHANILQLIPEYQQQQFQNWVARRELEMRQRQFEEELAARQEEQRQAQAQADAVRDFLRPHPRPRPRRRPGGGGLGFGGWGGGPIGRPGPRSTSGSLNQILFGAWGGR